MNNSIPVQRILEKADSVLAKKDYHEAFRLFDYWLREAESENDRKGMLAILNEQIGLFRKTEKETEALEAAEKALSLARELYPDGSVTYGTTLLNAATAYKAFGKAEKAYWLYSGAKIEYEKYLDGGDPKFGGLYNNMALALTELGRFSQAKELFMKALDIMSKIPGGQAECAITHCNLADLAYSENDTSVCDRIISEHLTKAKKLLDSAELVRNGYYAFVCEKCAPAFGFHGFFAIENELKKRAEEIYERA